MNKDIRTHHADSVCDICGRSLLRGERAEVFVGGGVRHTVCELCKMRALNEGWVREGSVPDFEPGRAGAERRRSLLGRLRRSRPKRDAEAGPSAVPAGGLGFDDGLELAEDGAWDELSERAPAAGGARVEHSGRGGRPTRAERLDRSAQRAERAAQRAERSPQRAGRERSGEPRHVRAVPTSDDQKIASAIDVFNSSEHRRTVAGVARSLGAPVVSIAPDPERQSLVWIVFAWELCWYRYEVDLAGDGAGLRLDDRGYELDELSEQERVPNAVADEVGQLRVP